MVDDTIVTRLAPICVVQFSKDFRKDEKLRELDCARSGRGE
jgi:hypothetical protein